MANDLCILRNDVLDYMPSPSTLTAVLRTQSYPGLDAINRELCGNRIKREGGKDKYIQRLRRSLRNSLDSGDINWADILDVLQSDNEARTRTRIKDRLENITFSKTTRHKEGNKPVEYYVTAETFQALQWKFKDEDIEVCDEKWQSKSVGRPDITIRDGEDRYVLEVKTSSLNSLEKLKEQVNKYKEIDGFQWLFVLYVTTSSRMTLDSNTKRNNMMAGLKGYHDKFTVIEKGPDSFSPTK